jgi:hypothetical protein
MDAVIAAAILEAGISGGGTGTDAITITSVALMNSYLAGLAAGTPCIVAGGVYRPDFMASGTVINIPSGMVMIAKGTVEIRTSNPSRGIFRHVGTGGDANITFIGDWRFIGDFNNGGGLARPDHSWKPATDNAAIQAWITAWNAANPTRTLPLGNATDDFKVQWNNATWNTGAAETKMQTDGQFSTVNRCSGLITENSNYINTRAARFYVENMVTAVTAQGKTQTAAAWFTANAAIPASPTAAGSRWRSRVPWRTP